MNNLSNILPAVLIVDDEPDICYLLNNILKKKNIRAKLAGSLAEADKLIEKQRPSIIFLDNHLPDGLGLENIGRLKNQNPSVRIVMVTAHDNPADRQKAYREGADFFISKPFTTETIYNTLDLAKDNNWGKNSP